MPIVPLKELKSRILPGKRLLAIDHGAKTWGLALADPALGVATPLKTIRRTKFAKDVKALAALAAEYAVGAFVIGLPVGMDGSEGPRCDSVRHFADNLLAARDVFGTEPLVAFMDERLSTHAAADLLTEGLGMRRERRKEVIDAQAAAQILSDALESMNKAG